MCFVCERCAQVSVVFAHGLNQTRERFAKAHLLCSFIRRRFANILFVVCKRFAHNFIVLFANGVQTSVFARLQIRVGVASNLQ